jgi:hypothetical protein
MLIDPNALAQITATVGVIGNEYLKGVASDAGKATWSQIKEIFGWTSDPGPAEISEKAASALKESPDLAAELLGLLKSDRGGKAAALVGNIEVSNGGKVVIAGSITNLTM